MDGIQDIVYFPWKSLWMALVILFSSGNPAKSMNDTSAQILFPWKCLWKTLKFVYFFHGIPGPFFDNFAWNSSVFHRGGNGQIMEWPIRTKLLDTNNYPPEDGFCNHDLASSTQFNVTLLVRSLGRPLDNTVSNKT